MRTTGERLFNGLREILTGLNLFDIHKNLVGADERSEVVADAAGIGCSVVAAIADE
jgi:hypothetical protein